MFVHFKLLKLVNASFIATNGVETLREAFPESVSQKEAQSIIKPQLTLYIVIWWDHDQAVGHTPPEFLATYEKHLIPIGLLMLFVTGGTGGHEDQRHLDSVKRQNILEQNMFASAGMFRLRYR